MNRVNEIRKMVSDVHVKGRPDIFKGNLDAELKVFALTGGTWSWKATNRNSSAEVSP